MSPGYQLRIGESIDIKDTERGGKNNIRWVLVNGKLIADRNIFSRVSFSDLQELEFVQDKPVKIDGQPYILRMLRDSQEWMNALDVVGDDDAVWHWSGQYSFLQKGGIDDDHAAGCCCTNPRNVDRMLRIQFRAREFGWRPVLESMGPFFTELKRGSLMVIWGHNSVIKGKLKDIGEYDLVIQCPSAIGLHTEDVGKFAIQLPGGCAAVNKEAIVGFKLI